MWVEVSHRHPLDSAIRPPKGKLLLLRPPRHWVLLPDAPFRDVYEIVEFQLPDAATRWQDSPLRTRLRVAPRLRQAGPADGAELWVLRGEVIEELNRFVQNAEDQLLARLAFAVGEKNGQTIVVLRVRPSKLPPPVVILPAEAYKSYLKLPNLFLPVGHILHPPLRRDIVRKLLAEDVTQITWLAPGEDSAFTPEGLPEDVFRPLTDWVDYVLDRDKKLLQAWVQAMQFEFEPFVCDEEQPSRPKKPPDAEKPRGRKSGQPRGATEGTAGELTAYEVRDEAPEGEEETALEAFAAVEKIEPSEIQKELHAVEEEFLSLPGTLDDDAHQALWPRLAELNARLGKTEDAGICWLNALWESGKGPNGAARWTAAWLRRGHRGRAPLLRRPARDALMDRSAGRDIGYRLRGGRRGSGSPASIRRADDGRRSAPWPRTSWDRRAATRGQRCWRRVCRPCSAFWKSTNGCCRCGPAGWRGITLLNCSTATCWPWPAPAIGCLNASFTTACAPSRIYRPSCVSPANRRVSVSTTCANGWAAFWKGYATGSGKPPPIPWESIRKRRRRRMSI